MTKFVVITGDNFIWNRSEFLEFLIKNQGQSIALDLNSEGPCCRATGIYELLDLFDFESVIIYTANVIEQYEKYKIVVKPRLIWAGVRGTVDSQYHVWNGNKVFCAYYGRPLWHRIGIASYLQNQYPAQSAVNLRGCYNDPDSRKLFELQQLFTHAPEQVKDFSAIAELLPLIIEQQDGYTPGQCDTMGFTEQLLDFYPNILIDIVAETYTSGSTFFPTEKTFRPMLMKKPFVAMCSRNYLIYLRQMGFRTFYEFWNEDYDGYDPEIKFHHVLDLIKKLSTLSPQELRDMYHSMQHILDHNYNLLITRSYKTGITIVND